MCKRDAQFLTALVKNNLGDTVKLTTTLVNFRIAATTQCEPIEARKIVPCFDEPEYKAIWNVTIIHPSGTTAIANAIELSETT
ncbi:hypothetical protein ANCDUO_15218 [Ancylostoma duodenale]|uniref:Aminopeptidase N-like N-terminal domain-containing protein n=1 Tax=Ancylostoma duodenale TaxID=51022 RepID=A0A0C2G111_9BILA|nr:hypothetical protein ANCDUO_15218 [Ancylostoma duodenale]